MGRATGLRFTTAGTKLRAHAGLVLDDTAEALLTEANTTVPIEEAVLEGSGFAATDRKRLVAVVAYDTPYAVRQHEDTRLRHDPGRRAKWLEQTFKEHGRRIFERCARRRGQAR